LSAAKSGPATIRPSDNAADFIFLFIVFPLQALGGIRRAKTNQL